MQGGFSSYFGELRRARAPTDRFVSGRRRKQSGKRKEFIPSSHSVMSAVLFCFFRLYGFCREARRLCQICHVEGAFFVCLISCFRKLLALTRKDCVMAPHVYIRPLTGCRLSYERLRRTSLALHASRFGMLRLQKKLWISDRPSLASTQSPIESLKTFYKGSFHIKG